MSVFDNSLIFKKEGDPCTDGSGRKGKVHFPPFSCPQDVLGEPSGCAAVQPQPICKVSGGGSSARKVFDFSGIPRSERRKTKQARLVQTKRADSRRLKEKAKKVTAERLKRKKPLTSRRRKR